MANTEFDNFIKNNFKSFPVLENEVVLDYIDRYHEGDLSAKEYICCCNYRLVLNQVEKYLGRGLDKDDLFQEGFTGLARAVDKFDGSVGAKFSTYATRWIESTITRALRKQTRTVSIPEDQLQKITKMKAFTEDFYAENGRFPDDNEIAWALDLPVDAVVVLRENAENTISLDYKEGCEEDDADLYNLVPADSEQEPEQAYEQGEFADVFEKTLNMLPDTEREVVTRLYGLFGHAEDTLSTVSRDLGVSRETVRQIKIRAIDKLRVLSARTGLDAYSPAA